MEASKSVMEDGRERKAVVHVLWKEPELWQGEQPAVRGLR